jgi:hypothetical protein
MDEIHMGEEVLAGTFFLNDHEKVRFAAHQLFGTAADWWETYHNSHQNVGAIT